MAGVARASFVEIIQEEVLRQQLRALNPSQDGRRGRTKQACPRLWRLSPPGLAQADGGPPTAGTKGGTTYVSWFHPGS